MNAQFIISADDTNLFTIEYPLPNEISNVDDLMNNQLEKNLWLVNGKQIII